MSECHRHCAASPTPARAANAAADGCCCPEFSQVICRWKCQTVVTAPPAPTPSVRLFETGVSRLPFPQPHQQLFCLIIKTTLVYYYYYCHRNSSSRLLSDVCAKSSLWFRRKHFTNSLARLASRPIRRIFLLLTPNLLKTKKKRLQSTKAIKTPCPATAVCFH